jgi:carboxymethylenebutenolidase
VKSGTRPVSCFLVFPEVKAKAAAILVIHENKGLTDWVRGVADQLAEAGFIAIAPDFLSGLGPGGGNTDKFASVDDATKAIYTLVPDQVMADAQAAADHVVKLAACNGKLAVVGFCWGGSHSFRFATRRADLKAALVFYGSFQEPVEVLKSISCPVYGFYGGNDARVNASIPKTAELMKEAGKSYDPVTYEGAGHGFMRSGEDPGATEENRKGRNAAWERMQELLRKL